LINVHGKALRDGDPEDLARKTDQMLVNRFEYKAALSAVAKDLNWDVQKHRLIDVYKSVLNR